MRSSNKFMIVLSVLCLITIFQGVSSAEDASKAVKLEATPVALKECSAEDFNTVTVSHATTKNALHLQADHPHGLRVCAVLQPQGHAVCAPAAAAENILKLNIGGTPLERKFKYEQIASNMFCTIFTAVEITPLLLEQKAIDTAITATVEVKSFGHRSATVNVLIATVPKVIATAPKTKELTLEADTKDTEKFKFHELICKFPDCYIGVERMEGVEVARYVCTPGEGTKGPSCVTGDMASDKKQYTITSIHCETAACPASVTVETMTGLVRAMSTPKDIGACGTAVTSNAATTKAQMYTTKHIQPVMACAMWSAAVTKCTGDKEENEFHLKLGKDAKAPVLKKPFNHADIVAKENGGCIVFSAVEISTKLNETDVADLEISLTLVSKTLASVAKTTFFVGLQAFPYHIEKPGELELTTYPVSLQNLMCDYPQCQLEIPKADTYEVSWALCTRGDQTKKFPPVCKESTAEKAVAATNVTYVLATVNCKTACPTKINATEAKIVPTTTKAAVKATTTSSANTFHLMSVALILAVSLAA